MPLTHSVPFVVLQFDRRWKFLARWAPEPATRAVLLVHGLASSWETWNDWADLIDSPDMDTTDVFLFDYPSLGASVPRSAYFLREGIESLIGGNSPAFDDLSFPVHRAKPAYTRFGVVSHSLGSVIVRTALTEMSVAADPTGTCKAQELPVVRFSQLLIAPAILGSHLGQLLLLSVARPGIAGFQLIRNGGGTALLDLAEGSPLLNRLSGKVMDRVRSAPLSSQRFGLRADRTVHGKQDSIVVQGTFANDESYKLREGNHFSIVEKVLSTDDVEMLRRPST